MGSDKVSKVNTELLAARRLLLAAIVLLAACKSQDEVHVGDEASPSLDYVDVRDEPQHRHEFENDRVRIYDVLLPPGYTTLYHKHVLDTLYLVVHGSFLKTKSVSSFFSLPIGLPVPSGMVIYNDHARVSLLHKVTNTGSRAARLVGVELKFQRGGFVSEPAFSDGMSLKKEYVKARIYDIDISPGESTSVVNSNTLFIMIALTEATLQQGMEDRFSRTLSVEPASWVLFEMPGKIVVSNLGVTQFRGVLYELALTPGSDRSNRDNR